LSNVDFDLCISCNSDSWHYESLNFFVAFDTILRILTQEKRTNSIEDRNFLEGFFSPSFFSFKCFMDMENFFFFISKKCFIKKRQRPLIHGEYEQEQSKQS
jgi:hypothetical protein